MPRQQIKQTTLKRESKPLRKYFAPVYAFANSWPLNDNARASGDKTGRNMTSAGRDYFVQVQNKVNDKTKGVWAHHKPTV